MDREAVIYTPRLELHHLNVAEIISLFESPEDEWIYDGKSFAYEALAGMWGWVCMQEGVKTLRYTVTASNLASMALVNKFGFAQIG